jgi:hypothetical protein
MAFLFGFVGARLSKAKTWIYPFILGLFVFTFLHNLGSMLTRYIL